MYTSINNKIVQHFQTGRYKSRLESLQTRDSRRDQIRLSTDVLSLHKIWKTHFLPAPPIEMGNPVWCLPVSPRGGVPISAASWTGRPLYIYEDLVTGPWSYRTLESSKGVDGMKFRLPPSLFASQLWLGQPRPWLWGKDLSRSSLQIELCSSQPFSHRSRWFLWIGGQATKAKRFLARWGLAVAGFAPPWSEGILKIRCRSRCGWSLCWSFKSSWSLFMWAGVMPAPSCEPFHSAPFPAGSAQSSQSTASLSKPASPVWGTSWNWLRFAFLTCDFALLPLDLLWPSPACDNVQIHKIIHVSWTAGRNMFGSCHSEILWQGAPLFFQAVPCSATIPEVKQVSLFSSVKWWQCNIVL